MTSLIHQGLPWLIESQKDLAPRNVPLEGATVAMAELVRALLRHGTFDRYYFTCDGEDDVEPAAERLKMFGGGERAHMLPVDRVHELRGDERVVMLKNTLLVVELCALRRWSGRARWPITGLTHSLSYLRNSGLALFTTAWLLEDIKPHDCLVCTSRAAEGVYHKIMAGTIEHVSRRVGAPVTASPRIAVIPLGVDTERYAARDRGQARLSLGIPEDRFVVLTLGRLAADSKADPIPLLLAFRALAREHPQALLVMAGDDARSEAAAELLAFSGRLGLEGRVRVAPDVTLEQKLLYYSAADVFAALSDNVQETFGLTVIEAMSMGLPVVASAWNGYHDTVRDGETGILIPTTWIDAADDLGRLAPLRQDTYTHRQLSHTVALDVAAITAALSTLASSRELRRRLGEHARERAVREYGWPVVVRAYEDLWEELIESGRDAVDEPPGFGVSSYDYRHVFGHYASHLPSRAMRLSIDDAAPAWLPLVSPREQRLWHVLVDRCGAGVEMRMDVMVDTLARAAGAPETSAARFVARCLKYGAIAPMSGVDAKSTAAISADARG